MKKIFLCLALAIITYVGFSQENSEVNVFYGRSVAYTYAEVKNGFEFNRHDWTAVSDTIYVFVDWNFGTCAISNKFYNRFLFLQKLDTQENLNGTLVKVKAGDQNNVLVELHFLFRNDKTFDIKVIYNNLVYEYKVGYVEKGYPFHLFSAPSNEKSSKDNKVNNI